ncbi:heavy metal translocating P-type ATPase [Hydromonas duriensis]|uniref:Cu2+-exporting ATPase n=1 Tax=Hydromonas duriensis TaxID=1527608 RepID=A0A4R6Y9A5_9BURK|nr:cation-translocating P-type ATPase [Hydromonas duriensis]TDR32003.1 Cu2+-exporting ATPase [Hydromonas duriensis]
MTQPSAPHRLSDIRLRLGGVACVACTDLIERDLQHVDGVYNAQANYTLRRAFLQLDPTKITTNDVIKRIEKLGYHAFEEQANTISEAEKKQQRSELFRLLVAILLMMQSMMFMYPFYASNEADMGADMAHLMKWANFALTLPVMFFCATPIFKGAWAEIRMRQLGMDTPVAFALMVAFIASVYATITNVGHVYYDSITMFVGFLLSARYIQFRALNKAATYLNDVLQHKRLYAEKVRNYPADKNIQLTPADELAMDDVVFIASGEIIPADAILIEGRTSCSQALLTGESQPINKVVGDALLAGSTNIEQGIYARITAARGASELDTIERLAQQSAMHKPALARLAERMARYFLYGLLTVCALSAAYWLMHDSSRIVPVVVAILIITCPCALALAVPTVLTAATSALAKHHVLVIQPQALENLANVDMYAFDKTGTLTEDVQTLEHIELTDAARAIDFSTNDALQIAATLETASRHPIALALRKSLQELKLPERMNDVEAMSLMVGQGVTGTISGYNYRIGKPRFAAERDLATHELPKHIEGKSVALLCSDGECLAWFILSDKTRANATNLIQHLQASGCQVALVSGDKADVVMPFAASLNIQDVHANATPADKLARIQSWQAQGKIIAMTGDGINDAPVLQQANVAIAMGHGSSLTQMQADLVIQSGELNDVYAAHIIARRTKRLMRQNLAWAMMYNLIAIPLAATGNVTPLIASIGMAASSLVVVSNALRVLRPVHQLGN